MKRTQMLELRQRARNALHASGIPAATVALAPFIDAMAVAVAARHSVYVHADALDDDHRRGSVVARWVAAREEWLSDRTGPLPRDTIYSDLVNDLGLLDEADTVDFLDTECFNCSAGDLLRSTAQAVFGNPRRRVAELGEMLTKRTLAILHEEAVSDVRRMLRGCTAEFVYVPNWDGDCVDDMIEQLGLRARHWEGNLSLDDLQPCDALAKFLRWINIGTADLIAAARLYRPGEAQKLIDNLGPFSVERDPTRPSLVCPEATINMLENASHGCVPMFHCEIDLGALIEWDPNEPMALSARSGKVHLGLHDVVNGAGYMDTYSGTVVVDPGHLGFGYIGRWRYGIDSVYGIVKSAFRACPMPLRQSDAVLA